MYDLSWNTGFSPDFESLVAWVQVPVRVIARSWAQVPVWITRFHLLAWQKKKKSSYSFLFPPKLSLSEIWFSTSAEAEFSASGETCCLCLTALELGLQSCLGLWLRLERTPLVVLIFRPSVSGWNYNTIGSPTACWLQILWHLSLHNHELIPYN